MPTNNGRNRNSHWKKVSDTMQFNQKINIARD